MNCASSESDRRIVRRSRVIEFCRRKKLQISADVRNRMSPDWICDNTLILKRKESEVQDNRKRHARAAWKLRQVRKREREALAESVNSKHEKTQCWCQGEK